MNASLWDSLRDRSLQWLPEEGIGWYPVTESPYDDSYWNKYRVMDRSVTADRLTADRCGWVRKFWGGNVCDIGIGGGRFVEEFGATGYDINPIAVEWLRFEGVYQDPWAEPVDAITCWDSLEHIHDPRRLLAEVRQWVFTSLPIFTGPDHVLRSKHFRKDEHCWYFTRDGLIRFMGQAGFAFSGSCDMEQAAGREDILTFAFRRVK